MLEKASFPPDLVALLVRAGSLPPFLLVLLKIWPSARTLLLRKSQNVDAGASERFKISFRVYGVPPRRLFRSRMAPTRSAEPFSMPSPPLPTLGCVQQVDADTRAALTPSGQTGKMGMSHLTHLFLPTQAMHAFVHERTTRPPRRPLVRPSVPPTRAKCTYLLASGDGWGLGMAGGCWKFGKIRPPRERTTRILYSATYNILYSLNTAGKMAHTIRQSG